MTQEQYYRYVSALPLPLWLAMILAPRSRFTQRAARSSTIFVLMGSAYVVALAAALRKGGPPPDFTSLAGLGQGFGTPEGALGTWTHVLALDLFTGAWIYRQSIRLRTPGWVRTLALIFTFVSGPLGLALFLLWRRLSGGPEALRGYPEGAVEAL
ncbi:MAG: ABA4-like family protein [Candidatus Promineifilaceae bacterium]|nr:ABA4-like family protein [Candidatus Promineifilaceae bacterium]